MKVLLTGGAGDLAAVLAHEWSNDGTEVLLLDVQDPRLRHNFGQYINASILDFTALEKHFVGVDCVVHIAAWHGLHESTPEKKLQKNRHEFFDLNVKGTFHVLEAAVQCKVPNVLFVSSTSVDAPYSVYGNSKILGEKMVRAYAHRDGLNTLTLRPRAFIPSWNHQVYSNFTDWLKWFWKGAVHINDVAQAVTKGVQLLTSRKILAPPPLPIDGAYDYSDEELKNWQGAATFQKYYGQYLDLVKNHQLDPARKPKKLDIFETATWLGYVPAYSLRNALEELERYGNEGPPAPSWLK